jgi:hypothetical protein
MRVTKSESGNQYFVVNESGHIVKVFYKQSDAVRYQIQRVRELDRVNHNTGIKIDLNERISNG